MCARVCVERCGPLFGRRHSSQRSSFYGEAPGRMGTDGAYPLHTPHTHKGKRTHAGNEIDANAQHIHTQTQVHMHTQLGPCPIASGSTTPDEIG